jgi:hypothetical protein
LGLFDSLTYSNEGSTLDETTLGPAALLAIMADAGQMRQLRRIRVESRLELAKADRLFALREAIGKHANKIDLGVLIGFESQDPAVRSALGKPEAHDETRQGLNEIAIAGASLATYIMYKPLPWMTNVEAVDEAIASAAFLQDECSKRDIPLEIRINPAYIGQGTQQAETVSENPESLVEHTDLRGAMRVAQWCRDSGIFGTYIGLSPEGNALSSWLDHPDYHQRLEDMSIAFNRNPDYRFPERVVGG